MTSLVVVFSQQINQNILLQKNVIKELNILKFQLIFPMQFANCESNSFFISTLKKLFDHKQPIRSRAREQIQNRDLTFN